MKILILALKKYKFLVSINKHTLALKFIDFSPISLNLSMKSYLSAIYLIITISYW